MRLSFPLALIILSFGVLLSVQPHSKHMDQNFLDNPPPSLPKNLDSRLAYYAIALRVQHAGDLDGKRTSLKDYSYKNLKAWLEAMDALHGKSNVAPYLAAYYFGSTQRQEDARHMIDYLVRHALEQPQTKWRWFVEAIYLARHVAKNDALALDLAHQLASLKDAQLPPWAKEMPAFMLHETGQKKAAMQAIETLLSNDPTLPPSERAFLENYMERLKKN